MGRRERKAGGKKVCEKEEAGKREKGKIGIEQR